jgi:hypothetical protein
VNGSDFGASADPLGPGPVAFAWNGGVDFGPGTATASPAGTLATQEDLGAIAYSATVDTALHLTCTGACDGGRVAVELTAISAATSGQGWPYPSVGVVRCVFPVAASVTLPHAAIAAMLASDASLDTVRSVVVALPPTPATTSDTTGQPLVADVGRGVFGVAPR